MVKKSALILVFIILAACSAVGGENALVIDARSNGLPGFEKDKAAGQKIIIQGDRMRIEDKTHKVVTVVRLDKKEIWQIDGNKPLYYVTAFKEIAGHRKKYLKQREQALTEVSGYERDRKKYAAELWGFRMDPLGKVFDDYKPEMECASETRTINGFKCRRIKFKEYGRTVFDAWVTDEADCPENMFRFYADLHFFAPEIVKWMKQVKGFPVKIKVNLYKQSPILETEVETEVLKRSIRAFTKKELDRLFEPPPGYTRVEKKEPPKEVPCPQCKKMVNIEEAKKAGHVYCFDFSYWVFDSDKCKKEFIGWFKKQMQEELEKDDDEEESPEKPQPKKKPTDRPKKK